MAVQLPDGRRGRLLAVGITVLIIGAIWSVMIAPALQWYAERNEQWRLQVALADRMAALVETLPGLRREAELAGQESRDAPALLTAGSDTVAAASLQQKVDEMATAAGLRLTSEEILPPAPFGDLRGISVRASVHGPWRGLVILLRDLALAEIPMIADDVQLRGLTGTAPAPDSPVDATVTVTSYRAAGDAK